MREKQRLYYFPDLISRMQAYSKNPMIILCQQANTAASLTPKSIICGSKRLKRPNQFYNIIYYCNDVYYIKSLQLSDDRSEQINDCRNRLSARLNYSLY